MFAASFAALVLCGAGALNAVGTYTNPLAVSVADPFVLKDGSEYYLYGTSSNKGFFAWKSEDLVHWKPLGLVFDSTKRGNLGKMSGDFWAPECYRRGSTYYLIFTARWFENGSLRLWLATASSPEGPFREALGRPLFDPGYATIDGDVFEDDDGQNYLYYSRDCSENVVGAYHESHIYGVRLSGDMRTVIGEPVRLLRPEQRWETGSGSYRWNEGPFMLKHGGKYYLMYSGNYFASRAYSVGYAVADSPLGPFTKYEKNPVLSAPPNQEHVSGPGHNCVTVGPDGALWCVYHEHLDPVKGGGDRVLAIDRMGFKSDGVLYVDGPTWTPQPAP
jgi:beta-xylosidase